MAILNTMELNKFALEKFGAYFFWIGATDQEMEDEWKWIDGSRIELHNWQTGEPNGGRLESCLYFYGQNGKWYDVPCGRHFKYLCDRRRTMNKACTIVP